MISPIVRSAITVATFAPVALLAVIVDLWHGRWVSVGILGVATTGVVLTLAFFYRVVKTRNPDLARIDAARPRLDALVSGVLSLYVIPAAIVLLADPTSRWAALTALLFIVAFAVRSNTVLVANPMFSLIGIHPHDVEQSDGTTVVVLSRRRLLYAGELARLILIDHGIYIDLGPRAIKVRT